MAGKEGEGGGGGDWVKPFHGSIRPNGVSATPCGLLAPPSKMAPATPTHPTPSAHQSNTCSLGLGFTLTVKNLPV